MKVVEKHLVSPNEALAKPLTVSKVCILAHYENEGHCGSN
jgi:hypothetical protein